TFIAFGDFTSSDGPFAHGLRIEVAMKHELPASSLGNPFDLGLAMLVVHCEQHFHRFMRLQFVMHRPTVIGGRSFGQDALIKILSRLQPYLGYFLSVTISGLVNDTEVPQDAPEVVTIKNAFSDLRHIRLEGKTALLRLALFPQSAVRDLEVHVRIAEEDVQCLTRLYPDLDFLVVGPVNNATQSCSCLQLLADGGVGTRGVCYPSVMRITADQCMTEQFIASVPGNVSLHLMLAEDCPITSELRRLFAKQPRWSLSRCWHA
ncbi:hypothetical protein HDZ31DRAFT_39728, partial [Schizophyllum fasciatum]